MKTVSYEVRYLSRSGKNWLCWSVSDNEPQAIASFDHARRGYDQLEFRLVEITRTEKIMKPGQQGRIPPEIFALKQFPE